MLGKVQRLCTRALPSTVSRRWVRDSPASSRKRGERVRRRLGVRVPPGELSPFGSSERNRFRTFGKILLMKPVKYSPEETNKIDLGTKVIYKYPSPNKDLDIGLMVVKGRYPENDKTFLVEHGCNFVIYVTKGEGIIYAGDETFLVKTGDVIFVPKDNKFAVEGDLEYVTVDSPAYFPEQSEEIKLK